MTAWGAIQELNADKLVSNGRAIYTIDMIMDNDHWLDFPAEIVDGNIIVAGITWTPED